MVPTPFRVYSGGIVSHLYLGLYGCNSELKHGHAQSGRRDRAPRPVTGENLRPER